MRRIIYCLLALCLCACSVQQTEENGETSETVTTTTTPKTVEEVVTTKWVSPIATAGDLERLDDEQHIFEPAKTGDEFVDTHNILTIKYERTKLPTITQDVYLFTVSNPSNEAINLTELFFSCEGDHYYLDTNLYVPAKESSTFYTSVIDKIYFAKQPTIKLERYTYTVNNETSATEYYINLESYEHSSERTMKKEKFVYNDAYTLYVSGSPNNYTYSIVEGASGDALNRYLDNPSNYRYNSLENDLLDMTFDMMAGKMNVVLNLLSNSSDKEHVKVLGKMAKELGYYVIYDNDYAALDTLVKEHPNITGVYTAKDMVNDSACNNLAYCVVAASGIEYTLDEEMVANAKKTQMNEKELKEYVLTNVNSHSMNVEFSNTSLTKCEKEELLDYLQYNVINDITPRLYTYIDEEYYSVAMGAEKPVIYIYDNQKETINLSLHFKDNGKVTLAYPEYRDVWQVETTGTNTMMFDGREYRYLYYEADVYMDMDMRTGFVVRKEDSAKFLEEKLAYMGLTDLEINDFITYWLPYLNEYPYNFIHFANDAYDEAVQIDTDKDFDSMIRIFMVYKGLNEEVEVEPQMLKAAKRSGTTLVEWGGGKLH